MFKNVGKKIKTLAKVICWIGIVCSILMGVAVAFTGSFVLRQYGIYTSGLGLSIALGVIIAILGSLFSWIGCFTMLGYGEIVDKVCAIAENTKPAAEYPEY